MKKYAAEFAGTAAMVFCGTGAIILDHHTGGMLGGLGISAVFGIIVSVVIYSLGHVSGAHINPAVTAALWQLGTFPRKKVLPFIASQLAGAFAASSFLRILFPDDNTLGSTLPAGSDLSAFLIELVLMLVLMLVILIMSHGTSMMKKLAGLSIGVVVFLEALFAGPLTGASMNPARSIAPAVVSGTTGSLWVYIAAPFAGASLAVLLYKLIRRN